MAAVERKPSALSDHKISLDRKESINRKRSVDASIIQLVQELGANIEDPQAGVVARSLSLNTNAPMVEQYAENMTAPTHKFKVKVLQIYDINRPGDLQEFRGELTNHKLLWHATPPDNVYNVLRDGYRAAISPENATFGQGIYFTDCITKALGWASNDPNKWTGGADDGTSRPGFKVGYVFLSQVALDQTKDFTTKEPNAKRFMGSALSVYGKGSYRAIINENCVYTNTQPPVLIQMGPLNLQNNFGIKYNEFVVFNPHQIRHKHLVKVEIVAR